MKMITLLALLLLITASPSVSDSLWEPGSTGLLSGSGNLQAGDTILVNIDIEQDLTYNSSRIDSERVTIELSGGEGENLFGFLPLGSSSGNQSLRGDESLSFQTSFAVSILGTDESGRLLLQGGRTIVIQGKQATVTITGTADPSLVGEDRSLPFSRIVDARIVYETFLSTGAPNIQSEDIVEVPVSPIADKAAAGEEAAAGAVEADETETGAGGTEAAIGEAATDETVEEAAGLVEAAPAGGTEETTTALSEEKKRELLLLYLNRLIDLVFE